MQSRSYESRSSGADAENSGHLSDHSQGVEEDSEECGIGIKVSQFKGRYEVTEMAPGGPASQTGQIFVGEAAQRPAACRHASAQPQFRWPRTRTLRAPGPRKHGPRGCSMCTHEKRRVTLCASLQQCAGTGAHALRAGILRECMHMHVRARVSRSQIHEHARAHTHTCAGDCILQIDGISVFGKKQEEVGALGIHGRFALDILVQACERVCVYQLMCLPSLSLSLSLSRAGGWAGGRVLSPCKCVYHVSCIR